jgi:xylan 1,4-beta-xylosidase
MNHESPIQNPILKGFHPDPSIIRVGEDYYIATSTFEWFPGVQIHHSKDLKNWQLVARPLNRITQLNLLGVPDSCGVWAPCLTYDKGTFYLVYTNVKSFDGVWKDTPNYLVTTDDILGDWSEPIYLGSSGFDGALFHDDDGRKWFTCMITDHRKGQLFGGIVIQEYSEKEQRLVGQQQQLFDCTKLGCTEAPHIYKRKNYYYLMTAEGGTGYHHAITFARSKTLLGEYEIHPENPIISAREFPDNPLQKAGHGDLVETQNGDWYVVFLVGRPLTKLGRCTLGRETAIAAMEWRTDDWLYAKNGALPSLEIPAPNLPSFPFAKAAIRDDFDTNHLDIHFQSLRIPITESWLSLTKRKGFLRLYGQESLSSFQHQSLIARRVQSFHIAVSTCVEFEPKTFQQMAGLICYYNTAHFHYLHLLGDYQNDKKYLNIISFDNFKPTELAEYIEITGVQRIYLKAVFHRAEIQFYYATIENQWQKIGNILDGSILSDDYVCTANTRYRPAFTGAFVGLCCQDLSGAGNFADFDWLAYEEIEEAS